MQRSLFLFASNGSDVLRKAGESASNPTPVPIEFVALRRSLLELRNAHMERQKTTTSIVRQRLSKAFRAIDAVEALQNWPQTNLE
jgi:hypothetical protein